MIAEKRFILKKLISPFSIKIRNVSMKMIVLMKRGPHYKRSKGNF